MREILFRGRCNEVGKYKDHWIEGHYGEDEGRNEIFFSTKIGIVGYSCEPESIGQYTGLTDKNGKKTFEGDILKICYDSPLFDGYDTECICYNGVVKYENALFVCEENSKRSDALCALSSNEFEIIGNIHDNPELLGGDKNEPDN